MGRRFKQVTEEVLRRCKIKAVKHIAVWSLWGNMRKELWRESCYCKIQFHKDANDQHSMKGKKYRTFLLLL